MTLFTRGIGYWKGVFPGVAMGAAHIAAVKIGDVAGQAEAGGAFVVKRFAIDRGGLPGDGGVAAGAVGAKHRLVFLRLGVAGCTFLRRACEVATGMAAFAACGFVGTGQGKQLGVLGHGKVRHGIQPIVAVQAVGSVRFVVLGYKFSIQFAVAVGAGAVFYGVAAFVDMAVGTGHFSVGAANIVVSEGKIGQAVVKVGNCGRFQIIICAFMFQMAAAALFDGG